MKPLKNLVLIEAPGKLPALRAALEKGGLSQFEVMATAGHVMTMPGSLWPTGIDRELTETARGPKNPEFIELIRAKAAVAERVLIASDADQEGDVLAWDLSQVLVKHPNVQRVRLRALDYAGVVHAFSHPEPVIQKDAWPGTSRRILDRLIGAAFSVDGETGAEAIAVGRIQSALLGLVANQKLPFATLTLTLPACDRHGPYIAEIPVHEENLAEAQDLLKRCLALAEEGCIPVGKTTPDEDYVPWNFAQSVIEISSATQTSVSEAASSLQRLYESGRMSYPRSTASAITGDALACLQNIAGDHGVKFDSRRVSQFARQSRHAHESPRPLVRDIDICAPIMTLTPDDQALSLITRHLIACGQPHVKDAPEVDKLPEWARKIPWSRKRSTCLRPWPRRQAESRIAVNDPEALLIRLMMENRLGRPSTLVNHAVKFASRGLVDDRLQLTEKGRRWLTVTPQILMDPSTSSLIERYIDESVDLKDDAEPPAQLVRGILDRLGLWSDVQPKLNGGAYVAPARNDDAATHQRDIGDRMV